MRKLFTIGAMLLAGSVFAQTENVGIGTKSPDESAILDLSSNKKGFLLPRMSESQRKSIVKPAQGLQVYQTDQKSGLYIFNGSDWTNAANSVMAATDPWLRGGNAVSVGEFLGTTNGEPLLFKVNNVSAGRIATDFNSNTYFGYNSGTSGTGSFGTAIGNEAMVNNNGIANIGIGNQTLRSVSGVGNIGIGTFTLRASGSGIVSGSGNIGIGHESLSKNTVGSENVGIGFNSLQDNLGGNYNFGLGSFALQKNTSGNYNVAIGSIALSKNTIGIENIAVGAGSLNNNISGNQNVAIGLKAGENALGDKNIFIGNLAGQNETSGNKLYISNSNTTTPLIYGDFSAKYVTIGDVSPALRTQALSLAGGYNLLVKGGILTEKVKVAIAQAGTDWADYVFEPEYKSKMMSLEEVEKFTLVNKHLPNVPSAQEMVSNGLDVGLTSKMFMEKIEELTLYIIELNKRIKQLESSK